VNGSLFAAMFLLIGRRHVLGLALAFYFVPLAIISNIFFNIGAPMGERLVYHSSIGFCIIVAWLLYKGFEKLNSPAASWGLAVAVVLLVSCSAMATIKRNKDWKNDATLFLADVEKVPNSLLANNNAAAACMGYAKQVGEGPERTAWFEKAIAYYTHALSVDSTYAIALLNRGLCYYNLHYPARALPDWLKVRQYNPGQQNLEKYMAIASNFFMVKGAEFETAGRIEDAVDAYGKSTEATPLSAGAWYKLGAAYAKWGQKENAVNALENSLKIDPSNRAAQQLYQQVSTAP
jgi:tetratricopeptide (TPR) repeat protein